MDGEASPWGCGDGGLISSQSPQPHTSVNPLIHPYCAHLWRHMDYLSSLHQSRTPCGAPGVEASLYPPRHVRSSPDPQRIAVPIAFRNKGVNPARSLVGEATCGLRWTHTATDTHTHRAHRQLQAHRHSHSFQSTGVAPPAPPQALGTARSAQPRAAPARARGEELSWAEILEWVGLDRTIKIHLIPTLLPWV